MRTSKGWAIGCVLALTGACAVALIIAAQSGAPARSTAPQIAISSGIFTPAHPTVGSAVNEFFERHPTPVQPIAFTHKVHLANGLQCETCHTGVSKGPDAEIPNVTFCMSCHQVIATDKPEIKKLAAYQARGEDVPWVRVYDYLPSAHLKFNHAPHIRAQVACSTCHGDMTQQTTAVRAVNLNMGACLQCHVQHKAPTDCLTCHY